LTDTGEPCMARMARMFRDSCPANSGNRPVLAALR